jgi:hypothetical protein
MIRSLFWDGSWDASDGPQERQISLTDGEREELGRIARLRSASHGLVRRIRIILASAAGESNTSIARCLRIANPTVCHWRNKWFAQGIAGLYGEARPGRPRTHDEEVVANLLRTVLETKPTVGSHWTVRSAAQETGLSKSTVARMFALFSVQAPARYRDPRCQVGICLVADHGLECGDRFSRFHQARHASLDRGDCHGLSLRKAVASDRHQARKGAGRGKTLQTLGIGSLGSSTPGRPLGDHPERTSKSLSLEVSPEVRAVVAPR